MRKRRVRRSAAMWRELFRRQASSGMVTAEFCRREGINAGVFRRWRKALKEGKAGSAGSLKPKGTVQAAEGSAVPFIDLGGLGSGSGTRFDIRLELGEGLVLSIARG